MCFLFSIFTAYMILIELGSEFAGVFNRRNEFILLWQLFLIENEWMVLYNTDTILLLLLLLLFL